VGNYYILEDFRELLKIGKLCENIGNWNIIGNYWKLEYFGELLKTEKLWRIDGNSIIMGNYWKLGNYGKLFETGIGKLFEIRISDNWEIVGNWKIMGNSHLYNQCEIELSLHLQVLLLAVGRGGEVFPDEAVHQPRQGDHHHVGQCARPTHVEVDIAKQWVLNEKA
jgi:hypothetical protein